MLVSPQLIISSSDADDLYSLLDSHKLVYTRLNAFSAAELEQIIVSLHDIPWEFLAGVISGYLGFKATKVNAETKRRVIIKYPDNSEIDATNIPEDELRELIHPHKQLYVSMREDNEHPQP
ncbi:TPA: hypothetical protein ACGUMO_002884 [Vibrio vulnificus]|uniref:hypothetical protein n=1 Tax=Vibrio navarrensis TaxID=29495 RepID=UPI001558F806|nr:hypothetical protein [Vibrio navarrensis]